MKMGGKATTRPLYPREREPVPLVQEAIKNSYASILHPVNVGLHFFYLYTIQIILLKIFMYLFAPTQLSRKNTTLG
jgi:hypothetical protein